MEKKASIITSPTAPEKINGLISWLADLFSKNGDDGRQTKRQLKQISKSISKHRYQFYRPKDGSALPSLAKFLYAIYKIIGNSAPVLEGADKSAVLKTCAVEYFFTAEQKQLVADLSEESIQNQAQTLDIDSLSSLLKDKLTKLVKSLNPLQTKKINETYRLLQLFIQLADFDYYFILKKFDPLLAERNFSRNPQFEAINSEQIIEALKDFQERSQLVNRSLDWDDVLAILFSWKNLKLVDTGHWVKVTNIISDINESDILTLMLCHATNDIYYKPLLINKEINIANQYLQESNHKVEAVLKKIFAASQNSQIQKIVPVIFGSKEILPLQNYNDAANVNIAKKCSTGFKYTAALSKLKSFLLDYFKKDIRELHELLLVHGQWTSITNSQKISETYYQVLELSDQIITFDESLREDQELGGRLKKAMSRAHNHDSSSTGSLRIIVDIINNQARQLIRDAIESTAAFAKGLKKIMDDIDRTDHEIIINWSEIETLTKVSTKTQITEIYKRLYYLIQLLQIYLKAGPEPMIPANSTEVTAD